MSGKPELRGTRRDEHGIVDRHTGGLAEPPLQPPRARAAASIAVTYRDDGGELEGAGEPDSGQLPNDGLGCEQVPAVEYALEGRGRVPSLASGPALQSGAGRQE